MNPDNQHIDMTALVNMGRALRYAEKEEAQARHGSTLAEYETMRRLGEGFTTEQEIKVISLPVHDLADNAGMEIIVPYRNKQYRLTATFEEVNTAANSEANQAILFARWRKDLRSPANVVTDAKPVSAVTKKTPTARKR